MNKSFFPLSFACKFLIMVVFFSFCLFNKVYAASSEMLGARQFIEISTAVNTEKPKGNTVSSNHLAYIQDLQQYEKKRDALPVEEAARQWMQLAVRYFSLPDLKPEALLETDFEQLTILSEYSSVQSLIASVPGPDSWEYLADLAKEQSNKGSVMVHSILKLFTAYLTGDLDTTREEIQHIEKLLHQDDTDNFYMAKQWSDYFEEGLSHLSDNRHAIDPVVKFEKLLTVSTNNKIMGGTITVPDLLAFTDDIAAERLLLNALLNSSTVLDIPYGLETQQLGRRLVRQHLDQIKHPQWGLTKSIEMYDVFEYFEEKFHPTQPDTNDPATRLAQNAIEEAYDYEVKRLRIEARAYYILGLLSHDKGARALEYAAALKPDEFNSYDMRVALAAANDIGIQDRLFGFYQSLLKNDISRPIWDEFTTLATALGKTAEVEHIIQEALTTEGLSLLQIIKLKKRSAAVLLSQDKVDEAVSILSEISVADFSMQSLKARNDFRHIQYEIGEELITLGMVLKRPDLREQGVQIAQNVSAEKDKGSSGDIAEQLQASPVLDIYLKTERFKEAEALLLKKVMNLKTLFEATSFFDYYLLQDSFSIVLKKLANVYNRAGRHEDVRILLDESPWWGKEDLIKETEPEFLLTVAQSLAMADRKKEAVQLLQHYLRKKPGNDEAYRLLARLEGVSIIPWLEELYSQDRFEERPLIWKAYLLLQEGKLEEAEKVIRLALKIDPTDGEQKAGQRVFSYKVLADILAAKGQAEDAAFFNNIVSSVRMAEEGDELAKAGLVQRSLESYRQAMDIFSDAYCIQWRLAEKLYATGDIENARKHYRVAFERMPEQFGQVASFCFGCEGAFDKKESRSVAEEVFSHLIEVTPDKPQVYMLLGLLRKSQDRYHEAYKQFAKAVELDADYLDAWKEIAEITTSTPIPGIDQDEIIFKMLALDPQQRHFSVDTNKISDLRTFWRILEQGTTSQPPEGESLYPLPASAQTIANIDHKIRVQVLLRTYQGGMRNYSFDKERVSDPGHAIADLWFIQRLDELVKLEHSFF